MTAADSYLRRTIEVLETLAATQGEPIERSAVAIATAIADGHRVFVAATSHVLHTELYLRAGGLAAVHPLGETPDLSQPMRSIEDGSLRGDGDFVPGAGDVVLVGTNAGTDAGTVQVAQAAQAAGCLVVGLTCVAYERWPKVVVEHPSGLKLIDLADILVDIGGVVGDGIVDLPTLDTAVGPTSGAALVVAAWAILVRAAELLVDRGLTPLVYRSVQIPGAEALFHERMATYERTREGFTKGSSTETGLRPAAADR
jgi:uncharacterized phosphosugar-binding protein